MKAFKAAHVPSLVLTRLVSPGWQSLWQLSGMLHSGLPAWPTLQRETEQTYFIRSNRTLFFFPPVSNLRYTWIALYMTLPKAQRLARLRPSLLTYTEVLEKEGVDSSSNKLALWLLFHGVEAVNVIDFYSCDAFMLSALTEVLKMQQ